MSSAARVAAIRLIASKSPHAIEARSSDVPELFGANVFGLEQMRTRLPEAAYQSLKSCMEQGQQLSADLADLVANEMKQWAIARGATHFTHWFQPMGASGLRHEIAHSPFVHPDDMPRFALLDAVAEVSPKLWFPNAATPAQVAVLGEERVQRCHALRDYLNAGATMRREGGADQVYLKSYLRTER